MKNDVEQLARSIASYADLLLDKRVRMEAIHSSTEPVRQISQNLTVMYTQSRVLAPAFLGPISELLKSLDPNAPIDLAKLVPTDRRRRYEWVEALKQGLDIPLMHVTYAPGSNVGNVHWVWHCTAENIDEALSISQPIIEQIKGDIPEYHTRAIRREAFQLFGLTTPTTKKAVLRHIYKAIALARKSMPEEMEAEATKCNSMKALRSVAERIVGFKEAILDSISPVKVILTDIAKRLELKEKKFTVFSPATKLDDLWTSIFSIDQEFPYSQSDKLSGKDLTSQLVEFMSHCCKQRHYYFDILKCGERKCKICLPTRLPADVFKGLDHLPDPLPGTEGHYKHFAEVFRSKTSEEHRPSLKRAAKEKTLPFYASLQNVKNADMMLMCDVCEMWRLVYSRRKLKQNEKKELEKGLDCVSFSCGAQLQDSDVPEYLKDAVFVRKMSCEDPIKKLYYSAKFEDICVYCSGPVPPWSDTEAFYPQCTSCAEKPIIANSKKNKTVNT
ncbi:hypothetical protein EMCRGX_G013014 [Ephydatia muelleri]